MSLIVFSSEDPKRIQEATKKLLEELTKSCAELSSNDIFDIRLCLDESIRNAMYHGNKNSQTLMVEVFHEVIETDCIKELVIKVSDEGEGFDFKHVPDPTKEENIYKDHGRGVFIIRNLMDSVEYQDNGKVLIMKKNLNCKLHKKGEVMDIHVIEENGIVIFSIKDDIDINTAPALKEALDSIVKEKAIKVIINLTNVTYMDSAGLATFIDFLKHVKDYGGHIKLSNMSSKIKDLFEVTKLESLFDIYEDQQDAITSF